MARRLVSRRREQTAIVSLDRIQDQSDANVRSTNAIVTDLKGFPFLPGKLVSVQLFAAVPKTIVHNLGAPATFLVARPNYDDTVVPTHILESSSFYQDQLDPKRQLSVISDDDCIVDLWLYMRASARTPL